MPARSVCLVTLSLSEAGPGRFGRQVSVTDIYHTIPYHNQCTSIPNTYRHHTWLCVAVNSARRVCMSGVEGVYMNAVAWNATVCHNMTRYMGWQTSLVGVMN